MDTKTIIIGNDHGGYEMKLVIVEYLKNKHFTVIDVGSNSKEIV